MIVSTYSSIDTASASKFLAYRRTQSTKAWVESPPRFATFEVSEGPPMPELVLKVIAPAFLS